jgi:hypothetical protein
MDRSLEYRRMTGKVLAVKNDRNCWAVFETSVKALSRWGTTMEAAITRSVHNNQKRDCGQTTLIPTSRPLLRQAGLF